MHTLNQSLPSLNEFKSEAKHLKKSESFKKLGHAQNTLAQKYGYKDFNAIRPALIALENSKNADNKSFDFDSSSNFDSVQYFNEELSNEEIITMKQLKENLKGSLEYSDPGDMLMVFSSHALSPNMKPVIGDEFFNTDDEAVAYELAMDELYEEIKECSDDTRIVERFNKDGDLLPYIVYKK